MPLVNTKKLLQKASKEGYAVGAFNFSNLEQLQAILEAAIVKNSPVILSVSTSAMRYMGAQTIVPMVEAIVKSTTIPVALHLDHGTTFEVCKEAIDLGFTSVMIDASHLDFDKNVTLTKQVVDYARAFDVTIEAELGKLSGIEDNIQNEQSVYTDPEQAKEFVALTGCDSLAISIGTSHGAYKFKGEPSLQIDRLKKIKQLLPNTPLVLHGASSISPQLQDKFKASGGSLTGAKGVDKNLIIQAIQNGIAKVNIDSDLRIAFTCGIRQSLKDSTLFNPRDYLTSAKEALRQEVLDKMEYLLNSANKA